VLENLKFVSDPMLFGRHIVELNGTNNTLVRSYAWGIDLSSSLSGVGGVGGLAWVTLHAASSSASGAHFTCYDGNGNVVALVSATTGDVTARYEYGPFGEPIRVSGPVAAMNPFRFSTKRTCNTTDLVLYEYRAYSPSLGRWPNRDPIGEFGGLNEYGFSANSPLNLIDLLGLQYRPKLVSGSPFSDSDKIRHFPYKMHYRFSATPTDSSLNVRAWVYGERWIVVWILSGAANVDTTISIICLGDGKITYSATGRSSDKDGVAQAVVAYNPVPLDEKTLSIHAVASGAVSADGGPEIKLGDVISISWPSPGLERTVQLGGFVWRCECGK
jgi:RHS repeat-associated protein